MVSHKCSAVIRNTVSLAIHVFCSQVRNEYRFQKAVARSLQIQSSFDRFLTKTKGTYNGLTGRPTDVRQYKYFRF